MVAEVRKDHRTRPQILKILLLESEREAYMSPAAVMADLLS